MQLATVNSEGKPCCRTVVFRGFMASSGDKTSAAADRESLTFITDARSSKMSESRDTEVCWYLTGTREQFRLSGVLDMISHTSAPGQNEHRSRKWQGLSAAARKQFLWPHPGSPRKSSTPEQDKRDFDDVEPSEMDPPDSFVLVTLRPER